MGRFRLARPAVLAFCLALALPAAAQGTPSTLPDEGRINLSGTVVEAGATSFRLDYGDGTVTVEFADPDTLPEAAALAPGDDVTVHGRIDRSSFDETRIEARAVFVEAKRTYYYASPGDEQAFDDRVHDEQEPGRATLRGTVRSTEPELDRFRLATGDTTLAVDTATLDYDPFDETGYLHVEEGDRVSVQGMVTRDFFEGRQLEATSIVSLEGPGQE
jgi:hypothetical protein